MATPIQAFTAACIAHAPEFGVEHLTDRIPRFAAFYELLLKWNDRLHLVAPCSPEEFAVRHVLESLLLLEHLPLGAAIVDIGSGGGLPTVPCLLARDDLRATLIESSLKKGIFLREALRPITSPERASVITHRFEELAPPKTDVLTCRALDRFAEKLPALVNWTPPGTTLALFVGPDLKNQVESLLRVVHVEQIPHSHRRFLVIGRRP